MRKLTSAECTDIRYRSGYNDAVDDANARLSAYRASEASMNEIFVSLSRKIEKGKEAVATLDSERAANAALSNHIELLESRITQLEENHGH